MLRRITRNRFWFVLLLAQAIWVSISDPSWVTGFFFGVTLCGVMLSLIDWYGDRMQERLRGKK